MTSVICNVTVDHDVTVVSHDAMVSYYITVEHDVTVSDYVIVNREYLEFFILLPHII